MEKNNVVVDFNALYQEDSLDVSVKRHILALGTIACPVELAHIDTTGCTPAPVSGMEAFRWLRNYADSLPVESTPTTYFATITRKSRVIIRQTEIVPLPEDEPKNILEKVDEIEAIPIIDGMLGKYSPIQRLSHHMSTLLNYIAKSEVKDGVTLRSSVFDIKTAKKVAVPHLPQATKYRTVFDAPGSATLSQPKLYKSMQLPQNYALLLDLTHTIYSQPGFETYSEKVGGKVVIKYNQRKRDIMPHHDYLLMPRATDIDYVYHEKVDKAWRFALASLAARGDKKANGTMSKGYYKMDLPSAEINKISKANDILAMCRKWNYDAVRMGFEDTAIAQILVTNSITVYTKYANNLEEKIEVCGIYNSGRRRCLTLLDVKDCVPTLERKVLSYKPAIIKANKEKVIWAYYGYVYPSHDVNYFPSMSVAEGRVWKTNMDTGYALEDLVIRFSSAASFRNLYPFTRVNFIVYDQFRDVFPEIIYPRLLAADEDFLDGYTHVPLKLRASIPEETFWSSLEPADIADEPDVSVLRNAAWAKFATIQDKVRELDCIDLLDFVHMSLHTSALRAYYSFPELKDEIINRFNVRQAQPLRKAPLELAAPLMVATNEPEPDPAGESSDDELGMNKATARLKKKKKD